MYFPVLINEADSGYPLILQLRAGNSHPGKGVVGLLRWLFWRLRKAWSQVQIIWRGDAGFSLPEIINLCERSGVKYAFGFSSNAVFWTLDKEKKHLRNIYANASGDDISSVSALFKAEKWLCQSVIE